jgi:hypothetical protein
MIWSFKYNSDLMKFLKEEDFAKEIQRCVKCLCGSHPREAASRPAGQQIANLFWVSKVRYRMFKSPPLEAVLRQLNAVHSFTSCFLDTHFNIIPTYTPRFRRSSFVVHIQIKRRSYFNGLLVVTFLLYVSMCIFCDMMFEKQNLVKFCIIMHKTFL